MKDYNNHEYYKNEIPFLNLVTGTSVYPATIDGKVCKKITVNSISKYYELESGKEINVHKTKQTT